MQMFNLPPSRIVGDIKDPVIVFSADYTAETVQQAREQGAQEFVVKGALPWDRLCAMITRYAVS